MTHRYHERLKAFIRKELTKTATELDLTNEEVSSNSESQAETIQISSPENIPAAPKR